MNEEIDDFYRIFYKSTGISERMLFPERYMNDEEKQKYVEEYIKFLKNTLERINKGE